MTIADKEFEPYTIYIIKGGKSIHSRATSETVRWGVDEYSRGVNSIQSAIDRISKILSLCKSVGELKARELLDVNSNQEIPEYPILKFPVVNYNK